MANKPELSRTKRYVYLTRKPKKRAAGVTSTRTTPDVLDVQMAAELLTVSADTVYDLFKRGDLPGRKVGRKWRTTRNAVLRWIESSSEDDTISASGGP